MNILNDTADILGRASKLLYILWFSLHSFYEAKRQVMQCTTGNRHVRTGGGGDMSVVTVCSVT